MKMEDNTIVGVDIGGTNVRVGKVQKDNVTDLYPTNFINWKRKEGYRRNNYFD
jgi:hypothetical protein